MTHSFFPYKFLAKLQEYSMPEENNHLPKISIVMPAYNQVQFIERSILSVLNQDYPNIELIIIDGGSNDGTVEIIQKYCEHIAFWVSEKDRGQSDALNKGFGHCTGEIYGWLNSDDLYLPDAFKHTVAALEAHPNKKIVFGDWLSIDTYERVIDYNHAFDFNLNHFKYEGFHLNAQSLFWYAEVHKKFSGFDIALYNTMDYQMILEFGITQGQRTFLRIPYALGAFRRYEGQKTGAMTLGVIKEHRSMAERYGYLDKFRAIGWQKRLYFRVRRGWWYYKRGGLSNLISRLRSAYVSRS